MSIWRKRQFFGENMKDIKVFIATPMYGGQCTGFYAQSILQLNNALRDAGITSSFAFMFNESLIQRARNSLVQGFMKSDHTHLFFIDADIKFHAPDVIKMIHENKPIICGIYPKKEINWDCVKRAIDNDVPTDQLKFHTGVPNVNLVGYQGGVTVARDQPFEIWNGATGFMMIKREVFEKLKKVVPSYTNDVDRKSTRLNSSH